MSSNTQKLRVLRSRTDHDLLILVDREIDRGLTLVDSVASRTSPVFNNAERAHSTATTLFARIPGLSADERIRVEGRIKQLRSLLDEVPLYANARPFQISAAS